MTMARSALITANCEWNSYFCEKLENTSIFSVFEAPDGHPYRDAVQEYVNNGRNMETHSPPPCEPKKERTKEEIEEKAAYDNIIETTQHVSWTSSNWWNIQHFKSIIAIGQTETVESNVGMEIQYREKAYKEKAKKMNSFQAKKEKPAESRKCFLSKKLGI